MAILRIEHAVQDFDAWKQMFDNDPLGRRESGVERYRILRSVDDASYVMIDLEFGSVDEAQRLLDKLQEVWAGPGRAVMINPKARIVETFEDVTL